jgi:predicted AAA+ superfamily ATPase
LINPDKEKYPRALGRFRKVRPTERYKIASIAILQRLYFLYLVRSFPGRLSRSLRKEPKFYLWDWSGG